MTPYLKVAGSLERPDYFGLLSRALTFSVSRARLRASAARSSWTSKEFHMNNFGTRIVESKLSGCRSLVSHLVVDQAISCDPNHVFGVRQVCTEHKTKIEITSINERGNVTAFKDLCSSCRKANPCTWGHIYGRVVDRHQHLIEFDPSSGGHTSFAYHLVVRQGDPVDLAFTGAAVAVWAKSDEVLELVNLTLLPRNNVVDIRSSLRFTGMYGAPVPCLNKHRSAQLSRDGGTRRHFLDDLT